MIIHVASLERVKTPGPMFSLNYKALDTGGEVIRICLTRDSNKPISLQHLPIMTQIHCNVSLPLLFTSLSVGSIQTFTNVHFILT